MSYDYTKFEKLSPSAHSRPISLANHSGTIMTSVSTYNVSPKQVPCLPDPQRLQAAKYFYTKRILHIGKATKTLKQVVMWYCVIPIGYLHFTILRN